LLDALSHSLPAGIAVLGIDRFGIDFEFDGQRSREKFEAPAVDSAALNAALSSAITKVVDKSTISR
jgi:hypothetical protein